MHKRCVEKIPDHTILYKTIIRKRKKKKEYISDDVKKMGPVCC